ncbi:putative quinol monooxygenase [Celeribacter sp. PS-C1]|uniref:putative quinol monooxygenase n=1 Tax=Celeribacter sp. PS-C1 TaxID=2820813 RepID=UPI001C686FEF|nr:antibiotic biosynthesis monooxygenase [Celeribacter sp. PS-C1]
MYKFIITIDLQKDTRDMILARAPAAQKATREEPGCIAYDFYTCTDNPDRLVFVETWHDEAAHADHMEYEHTKEFIAFHEQFHKSLTFETINVASSTD